MTAQQNARLTAEYLLPDLTDAERARAERVESVLPAIAAAAEGADEAGALPEGHLKLLGDAGLLGLVVPEEYGGLGGGLRDLAATTYTLGTVCGSTALAYFFHCSSSSRGMLPLAALDAGLYDDEEAPVVRAFAEKVLHLMGTDKKAIGNFASEAVKASNANVLIRTTATRTEGGWLLNGEKSFGCLSGSADYYLVTARREDVEGLDALTLFLVPRDTEGSRPRSPWVGLGMRASDNNGLVLEDCFVPDELSLAVPGAFTRATSMSRGSWVGNQIAIAAIYAGIAQGVWDYAMDRTMAAKFADTGKPIASSPMHQVLIGDGRAAPRRGAPVAAPPDRPGGQRPADPAQARGRPELEARQGRHLRACPRGRPGVAQDVRHLRRADGQHDRPRASATPPWDWSRPSRPSAASSTWRR